MGNLQQNSFIILDDMPIEQLSLSETPDVQKVIQTFVNGNNCLLSHGVAIHRQSSPREVCIPMHSHDFSEVIYCRQAVGVEFLVDSRRYRLQSGDIIFVPAGIAHRPLFPESMTGPFVRDELWLSNKFIDALGRRMPDGYLSTRENAYFLRTAGTKWEYIGQLFQKGVQESQEQAFRWENYVLGNAILLFVEISRAMIDEDTPHVNEEDSELLDRIMAYVDRNLAGKITLEETAKVFFTSKSTVTRTFRKHIGTSFYRYVTQRRLIAATALIQEGVPLEAIGEKVGFSDYPTFYRAFKQEYGISPKQLRQQKAQKQMPETGPL